MTVTHTDGSPMTPVDTDALAIGISERYGVLVTLADGVFPLVAQYVSEVDSESGWSSRTQR